MNNITFSERLKTIREKHNLTPKALAKNSNIPYSSYMKYESNRATPPIAAIIAIAKALQISTDELLGYATTTTKLQALNKELHHIGGNVIPLDKGYLLSTFDFDYMINDLDEFAQGLFPKLDKLQNNISELKKQVIYDYIDNYRNSHLKSDFNNAFGSESAFDEWNQILFEVQKQATHISVDELQKIIDDYLNKAKKTPASDPTTDKD